MHLFGVASTYAESLLSLQGAVHIWSFLIILLWNWLAVLGIPGSEIVSEFPTASCHWTTTTHGRGFSWIGKQHRNERKLLAAWQMKMILSASAYA